MVYKKFSLRVIIISVLSAVAGTLTIWAFTTEHLKVARITFLGIWILSIYFLVRYVNQNNRNLESFLKVLGGNDNLGELNHKGESFSNLNKAFNSIIDSLSTIRIEKEEQFHFFRTAVEQVGVGLLAFDSKGEVMLFNAGAKKLLNISFLNNISDINKVYEGVDDILWDSQQQGNRMLSLLVDGKLRKLSIRITCFKLRGEELHMVSFQDIRGELEMGELEAWQKLIRVITHEIMNSITPMKTLSTTLLKSFEKDGKPCRVADIDDQKVENAHLGLSAICKRSEGLAHFVKSYRSITRIPKPEICGVRISDLFQEVDMLICQEMKLSNVRFKIVNEQSDMEILADEKLIVQVLINLLRNAILAVRDCHQPSIEMGVQQSSAGEMILYVKDNGEGISDGNREQIFVPFFTTRAQGSGIGLSFSQQVMRLHKGNITVFSKRGEGARFELHF